jgi:pilus assembly protein Flp/PilA
MFSLFKRFREDEAGTTSIEYGLIGVLVSVFIIVAATGTASEVAGLFQKVDTTMSSATTKVNSK